MSKKMILIMLIVFTMLFIAGCGPITVRTACDCDCEYCDCGHDREEDERYNDPGEYEGWRD